MKALQCLILSLLTISLYYWTTDFISYRFSTPAFHPLFNTDTSSKAFEESILYYIRWHTSITHNILERRLTQPPPTLTWHCPRPCLIGIGDRVHGIAYAFHLAVVTGHYFHLALHDEDRGKENDLMPEKLFVARKFDWSKQFAQSGMPRGRTWNITAVTPFRSYLKTHDALVSTLRRHKYQHVFLCSNFALQDHNLFRLSLQTLFSQPVDNEIENIPQSYDVAIHARTGVDMHERYTDPRFSYLDSLSDIQLVTTLFDCAIAQCKSETRRIFFTSDSSVLTNLAIDHGNSRGVTVITLGGTRMGDKRTEEETKMVSAREWWMLTMASTAVVTTKSAFSTSAFAMSGADKLVRVRAWKKMNRRSRCEVVFDHNNVR